MEKLQTYPKNGLLISITSLLTLYLSINYLQIITIAPLSSVCLLYNDFLEDIGEGKSAITTQIGVGNAVISFIGKY